MKKTYMTPAISVMAMETAAILAGSGNGNTVSDRRPTWDLGITDPTVGPCSNQFSKEHNDVWDED